MWEMVDKQAKSLANRGWQLYSGRGLKATHKGAFCHGGWLAWEGCVCSPREVMLEEGTSKHRPGGNCPCGGEQVKKSPEAGLSRLRSGVIWDWKIGRMEEGPRYSQELVNGRFLAGKRDGQLWFQRLLWVNCLFLCAESISRGIHRIWSSWLPSGRGTRGDWGQGQEEEAL